MHARLARLAPLASLVPVLFGLAACGGAAWTPAPATTLPIAPDPNDRPKPVAVQAPVGPSAVDAALPAAADLPPLAHVEKCAAKSCRLGALIPDGARPDRDDKAPVWAWEQSIAAGSTLSFPRDAEVDVLGVVLKGRVALRADEKKAAEAEPFGGWQAFQAPGAGVSLRAVDGDASVVLVVASSGKPLAELVAARAKKPAAAWKKRDGELARADLGAVAPLSWGHGAYHARPAFDGEHARRASLGVLLASKDAPVAEHAHDKEWELLALLEGDGELVLPQAEGEPKRIALKEGSLARVAVGQHHAWKPTGKQPLVAVQVYTPPGPEQRFRKLAEHP
jgi:mannose-6-phosphate isomerase-like protein (cupin superfamily)